MTLHTLTTPTERVLPTLEKDGSRRWLYPRLSRGPLLTARRAVAYILVLIFNVIPFLSFHSKPLVLLNIPAREFTLLGYTFLPRDTILLAMLIVAWLLSIFFITSLLGRAWCGWACPQTVYMEFLFRPVERLFLGRSGVGGKPAKGLSPVRYAGMYAAFLILSLALSHTFLSYFVGVAELRAWITQNPLNHPWSFFIMAGTASAIMFNFSYFREQTCLIACPYGRFQSVLLDRDSLTVRYDPFRGEPRSKKRSIALPQAEKSAGDCVDCTLCVQTCPTGIDIRDGLQFECNNCAQCIDACNAVMSKVGRPTGLIRYSSQAAMEGASKRILRPRVVLYAFAIFTLLSSLAYAVVTKSPVDVLLVRNQGLPFVLAPDGRVENTARVQLTNRTDRPQSYLITVSDLSVGLLEAGQSVSLAPGATVQYPIHLLAPASAFTAGKRTVTVQIITPDYQILSRPFQLFGPAN